MSNAILCLSEPPFHKNPPSTQDENNYTKNENNYAKDVTSDAPTAKQNPSRKREASNILMECVKRRDNLRNIDSTPNVPCDFTSSGSFHCGVVPIETSMTSTSSLVTPTTTLKSPTETLVEASAFLSGEISLPKGLYEQEILGNEDLSDSSVADSGIECSKSNSPIHSVETSSISGLEDDICQNLMDIDDIELSVPETINKSVSCESDLNSKSVETSAAEDLEVLRLTDTSLSNDETEVVPKSPIIQSLFKNVPSVIYFSTKNEPVRNMPDDILQTMKWRLSTITPHVIRQVVTKAGFTLIEAETTEDWIGSWGKHLKSSYFKKLKSFQKVNHYPCGFHLGRKDRLWHAYRKMVVRHGKETYNFFPETFVLPKDLKTLRDAWGDKCWIIKPCASARGAGVKVIYKWAQVPKDKPFVVQRYISDPYLINGNKFDLRLYILIPSIEPLRIYVFEDGLVRFASQKYSLANKSFANRYIHLTNYSVNKKSKSYTINDDENVCQGHKWSLKSFWTYMANSGIDTQRIQATIIDMIIKTVLSAEGPICRAAKTHANSAYNCFELFGFDIMLDKDLHPWLLEVNISPSLHTKTKLDNNVKSAVVKDMLNIAGFEVHAKNEIDDTCLPGTLSNRHKNLKNRALTPEEKRKHALYTFNDSEKPCDILDNLTLDDLSCLMESEDELSRCGSFSRIFPTHDTSDYFPYFDHIRYYNVLLDAWERKHHLNRGEGHKLLQNSYKKMLQSPKNTEESTELVEATAISLNTS